MKKIEDYRRLLSVDAGVTLKDLKTVYRNLMKDCHPDKFADDDVQRADAEKRSKRVIEAYHFLVGISPETKAEGRDAYTQTVAEGFDDYEFKNEVLKVVFTDGAIYEYYGVPKTIYTKLVNADTPARFARRHIFDGFVYRRVGRTAEQEA
ncbi:MAG: KTSC domain-containing protein [Bacteroidetes bacterium]|nr:MAG: KTSC domain-containing protein [Bacteroidota bacterium]